MSEWNLPWEGGCRCGQVRLRVSAPPLLTMACHCTGCQRMTASAFSLSAGFPSEGFTVTKGEPVIGGLHGTTRHYFCPHCMSWMFTRPEGFDWFVNLRATMLDDAQLVHPVHRDVDERKATLGDHAGGSQLRKGSGFRGIREAGDGVRAAGDEAVNVNRPVTDFRH